MDKDLNIIEKLKDNSELLNSYLSFCNSNNHDIFNDELMEYLIMNKNINYFQYYMGIDKDITNYAIENGYTVKEEDFKKNFGFGLNNTLMYYLIKEIDINYFKYYKGRNDDIINYAIENGYEITEEDLKRNNYFREVDKIMIILIKVYGLINYYILVRKVF